MPAVLLGIEAEALFDLMGSAFAPAEDFGGEDAASDEEDGAEGKRPALARQGVRDVDDVLRQDTEEEDVGPWTQR